MKIGESVGEGLMADLEVETSGRTTLVEGVTAGEPQMTAEHRSSLDALRNAGEVAEVMKKSGTESVEILRERIRESMEEIREGYERKKK